MISDTDLVTVLSGFFADTGVHTREDAELPVAVLLRADRHRRGGDWSMFPVERFLAGLPPRLRDRGGALVLSTFFTWLSQVGELSRERARALSDRAVRAGRPPRRHAA